MIQRSLKIILIFSRSTLAPSSCSSSWRAAVVSFCWHLPTSPPQGGRMIWSWCFWLGCARIPHARRSSCLPASVALWLLWAAAEMFIRAKICVAIKQEMVATTCKGTANSFQPFPSSLELKQVTYHVSSTFCTLYKDTWLRNISRFSSKNLGAPVKLCIRVLRYDFHHCSL